MASETRRFSRSSMIALLLLIPLSACFDAGAGSKRELVPLAGVWEAAVLSVPNPEIPSESIELVGEGASYALSILSTGRYTAVFDLVLVQGLEVGDVQVQGDQIILTPTSPPGTTMSGTWTLQGDLLTVDALRKLDLDGDGADEVVPFHLELNRRDT